MHNASTHLQASKRLVGAVARAVAVTSGGRGGLGLGLGCLGLDDDGLAGNSRDLTVAGAVATSGGGARGGLGLVLGNLGRRSVGNLSLDGRSLRSRGSGRRDLRDEREVGEAAGLAGLGDNASADGVGRLSGGLEASWASRVGVGAVADGVERRRSRLSGLASTASRDLRSRLGGLVTSGLLTSRSGLVVASGDGDGLLCGNGDSDGSSALLAVAASRLARSTNGRTLAANGNTSGGSWLDGDVLGGGGGGSQSAGSSGALGLAVAANGVLATSGRSRLATLGDNDGGVLGRGAGGNDLSGDWVSS